MAALKGKIDLATFKGLPTSPNDKTLTEEFLLAAEDVIEMMNTFGVWMKPMTDDMRNNSTQIKSFYEQDVENRKYLEEMVFTDTNRSILLQLLWLCRSLELCIKFLMNVASEKDIRCGKSNDVQKCIRRAYDEVLKPYHGFFLQRTFIFMLRFVPSRQDILGSGVHLTENLRHIESFMPIMQRRIDNIYKIYIDNNWFDRSRV